MKYIALFIISFLIISVSINQNHLDSQETCNAPMQYDGKGYNAYLPAFFIYKDPQFGFYEKMEHAYYMPNQFQDYRNKTSDGKLVNKYFFGVALLQTPFFLVAHAITLVSSQQPDGYTYWYRIAVYMAGFFYTILGLWALLKFYQIMGIGEKNIILTLLFVVFGTNIYYYIVSECSLSHLYSFAIFNLVCLSAFTFLKNTQYRYLYLSAFLLGLIVLIRPINIIMVLGLPIFLLPFFSFKKFYSVHSLLSFILFLSVCFIQLLVYKWQTGHFLIYAYNQESLDFLSPNMIDFLISYKKGYFLYTPMALLSTLTIAVLYRYQPTSAILQGAFLFFVFYVLSSWYMWWYGGSFSSRPMIEYTIFTFYPLAFCLEKVKQLHFKIPIIALCILLTLFCQIQTKQYQKGIIHYDSMTKQMYWDNFLRLS